MAELSEGNARFRVDQADDGTATVTIRGELDVANIDALEAAVAPIVASRPERFVVDVWDLRFADSSAIALWLKWAGTVERFELLGASPLLQKVIASMGLSARLRLTK